MIFHFFTLLLVLFTHFQSIECILKQKDRANIISQLSNIFSTPIKYSEVTKLYNYNTSNLIENKKKREATKKSKKKVKKSKNKLKRKKSTTRKITTTKKSTTPKVLTTKFKKTTSRKFKAKKSKKTTRKKKIRTTTRKPDDKFAEYKNQILKDINIRREYHHVSPLQLNTTIAKEAQDYVENVLKNNFNQNINKYTGPLGEISVIYPTNIDYFPTTAWFCSPEEYDFENHSNKDFCSSYTLIIWKNTKQIGCGVAEDKSMRMVTCRVSPKGNIDGEYEENVLKP